MKAFDGDQNLNFEEIKLVFGEECKLVDFGENIKDKRFFIASEFFKAGFVSVYINLQK